MHFIREAGWPIILVLGFGGASLAAAVRYRRTLDRELFSLMIGLAIATLILGVLGTALGVQLSARHIHEVAPGEKWIFLLGLKESLNNLVAALVIVCVDTLIATSGAWRAAKLQAATAS